MTMNDEDVPRARSWQEDTSAGRAVRVEVPHGDWLYLATVELQTVTVVELTIQRDEAAPVEPISDEALRSVPLRKLREFALQAVASGPWRDYLRASYDVQPQGPDSYARLARAYAAMVQAGIGEPVSVLVLATGARRSTAAARVHRARHTYGFLTEDNRLTDAAQARLAELERSSNAED